MKGKKYYTDRERLETVKRLRASGQSITRFARENGIAYATLRDWADAFRDLEGKFVRLDFDESDPSRLMSTQDVTTHMLSEEQARQVSLKHEMDYRPDARIGIIGKMPEPSGIGTIVVATGGTSDIPVAEEAALTAEAHGNRVTRL